MKLNLIPLVISCLLISCINNKTTLPILGNRQAFEKEVNGNIVVDTLYQTIPTFHFLNQDSTVITDKNFDGKIYVADFFFTACNTICPIMHRNLLKVYNQFKGNKEVKFLSHSIDIKYDTPSALKKYAHKLGLEGNQWEFVQGSYDAIYNQAAKNYLTAAYQDSKEPQGMVHQGWFILVDKEKYMRGAYDGTKPDQVEKMIDDMNILLKQ